MVLKAVENERSGALSLLNIFSLLLVSKNNILRLDGSEFVMRKKDKLIRTILQRKIL